MDRVQELVGDRIDRIDVVDVVGGDCADHGIPGDLQQPVAKGPVAVAAVIEDLDAVAVPDRVAPFAGRGDRCGHAPGRGEPGDLAPFAPGQHEEPLGPLGDVLERDRGMPPLVGEMPRGDEAAKVGVASLVPSDDGDVAPAGHG